ncbi:unnamed protein product [Zymoseptoria tritici ST99CH_1E4]|uniref:Chitin-binding type-1 domain-containing protein n=1 Tax=Zymoseptoria tritici ST99CH_1E4 TaxID=1276532 RepID=A0A2H1H8P5_ZYMTR|nr:unnamed protein product [Zymoseptoria tritici ST99CH_1E4]
MSVLTAIKLACSLLSFTSSRVVSLDISHQYPLALSAIYGHHPCVHGGEGVPCPYWECCDDFGCGADKHCHRFCEEGGMTSFASVMVDTSPIRSTPARSSSSFLLLFLTFYPSQLHTHQVGPRIATRPLQTSNQVSSNTTAALFAPSSRRRNFNTAIAHLQSLGTTAVKMKLSIFAILAVVASVRAGSPCTSGVNSMSSLFAFP